ncbi:hypothetical protein C8J57DRAFT_1577611 [Mycena rebaudengoi]|nr:hypothetical protein C8J57DRAFT_1577611 [Mycena rebaudengoi]
MPLPQPQTPRRHFPSPAARSPGTPRRRSTKNATRLQGTMLDVLNLLPDKLDENTPREAVDKMLFYFDSEAACTNGVDTVRMALPEHLRDCVYTFSAGISEGAKKDCWEGFMSGRYRIICCTDAAGMGCNVPDVKITVIFGCSKSLAVVCQRWGRTGRGRETLGTCIFLVPVWAFRPAPVETGLGLAVQTLRGQPKLKIEPKTHTASRGRIERNLEAFINSASAGTFEGRCSHRIMAKVFRPRTGLTTYPSLEATAPTFVGELSQNSAYELTWISMDLPGKSPPRGRCCGPCNPTLLASFRPSTSQDHRLRQFARDFLNPITQVDEPDRPISPSSSASGDSESETVRFEPMAKGQTVSKAEKDSLKARLVAWRVLRHKKRGSSKFLSPAIALPDRQLETLVSSCGKFLTESVIEKKQILAVVKNWDFGTDEDFCDVAEIIRDWRKLFVSTTPKSQHRSKRSRTDNVSAIPVPPQPNFTPLRRAVNPTTLSRNAVRSLPTAEDVFSSPSTRSSVVFDGVKRSLTERQDFDDSSDESSDGFLFWNNTVFMAQEGLRLIKYLQGIHVGLLEYFIPHTQHRLSPQDEVHILDRGFFVSGSY